VLANRAANGEPRIRAQLAVARAELAARRATEASMRVGRLLNDLDPRWRCRDDSCPAPASRRTSSSGMERELIGEVVQLALRLDLADDLGNWARTRATAEQRAAAWLALAEAMRRP
jgi:hypothetical protein